MPADDGVGFGVATTLLSEIEALTRSSSGIHRPSYGEGESAAIGLLRDAARRCGLPTEHDFAQNLYISLEGRDPSLPRLIIGSHADSAPNGGNYDGLAGIAAGLAVLADLKHRNIRPRRTISAMAIRAEENAWFGAQHVGSRAALGLLAPGVLTDARRADSGRTLAEHMEAVGANLEPIRRQVAFLTAQNVAAYLELHIEQGPVLIAKQLPVGIVSAIRGSVRCMELKCMGSYGHSGAVPMSLRNDAVIAAARLVASMADYADQINAQGGDLVLTFGRFLTNPQAHGLTTIPGEATLSFDCRSHDAHAMQAARQHLVELTGTIGNRHQVTWQWSDIRATAPAIMDAGLRALLSDACSRVGVEPFPIASGAGHDAQDFIEAGIPAAMLFVRNANGSHNPDEAMALDDFQLAYSVLLQASMKFAGAEPVH